MKADNIKGKIILQYRQHECNKYSKILIDKYEYNLSLESIRTTTDSVSRTVSIVCASPSASASESSVTVSSSPYWSMPTYKFGPWGNDTDWYYDALHRYEITDASEVWKQWD